MEEGRKTVVIAVGNQKGGVGKTTTTVHLAAALAEMGRQVLIIDLDMNQRGDEALRHPRGNVPRLIRGAHRRGRARGHHSRTGGRGRSSSPRISAWSPPEGTSRRSRRPSRRTTSFSSLQDILIEPLKTLDGKYDYIFLDTAPNATDADHRGLQGRSLVHPRRLPEPFAIQGLSDALDDIRDAQRNGNPRLGFSGSSSVASTVERPALRHSLIQLRR